MQKRCENCIYAEWDYCEGVGGGYPRGFWAICGCRCTDLVEDEWDDEWGDTKDCPMWKEDDRVQYD